mgnify:CR=1 FL=1
MKESEKLLKHIQKTNPSMTLKRLMEELNKCRYSAICLVMIWQEEEKRS